MHVDVCEDCFVFDFVALEPAPASDAGIPAGTPFTMHIGRGAATDDVAGLIQHVLDWAASADLITMFGGTHDGSSWLCLTSNDTHLVVELA